MMQTGYPPIRRVVTGHDEAQVAQVLIDGPDQCEISSARPGLDTDVVHRWCAGGDPDRRKA